jgi:heme-degrading monooxygenase HmoA
VPGMILRSWRGWVASGREHDYAAYVERTGLAEYRAIEGNRGAQIAIRDLGDGRCEVITLSWWDSLVAIKEFAGDEIGVAKFYPEDDNYLVGRETTVSHFEVRGDQPNS